MISTIIFANRRAFPSGGMSYGGDEGMKEEKNYNTRQKKQILKFFAARPGECFGARELIDSPEIDVGDATVFRCLAKLAGEGRLKKYSTDKGAIYQYNESAECLSHFHLKCLVCGKVIHLECDFMNEAERHISQMHGFQVDIMRTVIYGKCPQCCGKTLNSARS